MTYEQWKAAVEKIYAKPVSTQKYKIVCLFEKPTKVTHSDMTTLAYVARKALGNANVVENKSVAEDTNFGANWKVAWEVTDGVKRNRGDVRDTLMSIFWDGAGVDMLHDQPRFVVQK